MANSKRIVKNPPADNQPKQEKLVVNTIKQVSVDRTPKDIGKWRTAHVAAESIFYPNRSRLYDLYSDVELDGHLTGIIAKRKAAVVNKHISFVKNKKSVDEINKLIKTNEFRDLVKGLVDSIMQGIYGFEFLPGDKFSFKVIPRKHIKPEKGIITINQSDHEGTPYEGVSNIWVVGNSLDLGLLLKCSFYALIKKGDFGDWAQYVEIFGQPIRVIKYDANDEKTKIQLQAVLDEAGSSLALMIPKQSEFDIMDGKTSNGDGQLQERLKNACNNEMSVIILGNTETTANDNGGSNAKAKEQGDQQLEITKDDLQFVINLLNSEKFLAILKSYGYDVEGGEFTIEKEIDVAVLSQRIVIDIQVSNKVPVSDDYFYETYGIPKPDNYDELKAQQVAAQQAQQQAENNNTGNDKSNNKKPPLNGIKPKLSAWHQLRNTIADFFELAP